MTKQEAERRRKEYEERMRRQTSNPYYQCSMTDYLLINNITIDSGSYSSSHSHDYGCSSSSYSDSSSSSYSSDSSSSSSSCD